MTFKAEQTTLFMEHILKLSNDSVTIINPEGKVLYWNEVAERTYNIPKEDILQQDIHDFFQPEALMVLQMLDRQEPVRGIYHRPQADKHVLINACPIYGNDGELIGTLSIEQDISRLVKLNEELSDKSWQLNELKQNVQRLDFGENPFNKIKGKSEKIQQVVHLSQKVAQTDATVLIQGESGVGKELFSRAIHEASLRKDKIFNPINCGAIPPALFESELFGYEPGTFTGGNRQGKQGKIEHANHGTLFLDEVGELPMDMQIKLLRVLQEKEIYRVGSSTPIPIDVRIIAATNRNLEQRIIEGKFREDLYYRLNVVTLTIPSLNQRQEDIPDLVQMFINEFANKYEKSLPSLSTQIMPLFMEHHWPGNIRELRNVIERMIILTDHTTIAVEHILDFFPGLSPIASTQTEKTKETNSFNNLKSEKEQMEAKRIDETIQQTYGNKKAAATLLGISRATLYAKMKKYNIHPHK